MRIKGLNNDLIDAAAQSEELGVGEYSDLIACLQDAGFDVDNLLP